MTSEVSDHIQEVFIGMLGRPADHITLLYWSINIERHLLTIEDVISNIVDEHPEFEHGLGSSVNRGELVKGLYENLFGRSPNDEGLEYWTKEGGANIEADQLLLALTNGASEADKNILASKVEVAQSYSFNSGEDYNSTLARYALLELSLDNVNDPYSDYYGMHHYRALPSQRLDEKIQTLYIGLLGRAADLEGLRYWEYEIRFGGLTLEQLRANFVNEQPEFLEGLGTRSREDVVISLYDNLLERAPDEEGLEYWVNGEGASVNTDQLILAILNAVHNPEVGTMGPYADRRTLAEKEAAAQYYTFHSSDSYEVADAESVVRGHRYEEATHAELVEPESIITIVPEDELVPIEAVQLVGVVDDQSLNTGGISG